MGKMKFIYVKKKDLGSNLLQDKKRRKFVQLWLNG